MPDIRTPGGAIIHYDTHGPADGDPLLLIEGLGAHLLGWRDGFWQHLTEAGFQVIRFDNRDVGLSQKYPGVPYSPSDMADDSHHLLQGLGLGPTHVVGQSMGGMIAQALAVRHPADVKTLALIYTTASMTHLVGDDRDAEALASIPAATSREEAVRLHVEQERICASTAFAFDEAWRAELGGLMWDRGYYPEGVVRQREALARGLADLAQVAKIRVPTTIIHGASDGLISADGSRELHAAIPESDLWIVEGMGHELPEPLWPALTERIIRNARRTTDKAGSPAA